MTLMNRSTRPLVSLGILSMIWKDADLLSYTTFINLPAVVHSSQQWGGCRTHSYVTDAADFDSQVLLGAFDLDIFAAEPQVMLAPASKDFVWSCSCKLQMDKIYLVAVCIASEAATQA